MSKRGWGGEFAVGLVAGGTLVLVVLVFWYGPTCSPYSPCSYPHQGESNNGSIWYDTAAQWVAAGTGVAVAFFTFWTVLLVRKALAADDAALNEARKQTRLAKSIGEAQTRAYVDVEKAEIIPDGSSGPVRLQMIFKNVGQSPARQFKFWIGWTIIEHGKDVPEIGSLPEKEFASSSTIGTGVPFVLALDIGLWKDEASAKATLVSGARILFYGRAIYSDIFGAERRTDFAIITMSGKGFWLTPHSEGNSST